MPLNTYRHDIILHILDRLEGIEKHVNGLGSVIVNEINTINTLKIELIGIFALYAKGIFDFRTNKIIYFSPNEIYLYFETPDKYIRVDVKADEYLHVKVNELSDKNEFYCDQLSQLSRLREISLSDKRIDDEIKTLSQLCER